MPVSGPAQTAHESANLRKYTTRNRIYRRHIDGFQGRIARQVEWGDPTTPPVSLLDAGCGEGFLTAFLADRWPETVFTGVDAQEDAVVYARNRFGTDSRLRFDTADVTQLPFEDGAFDATVCSQVLEHLTRPERALRELVRVTRRRLVVSVPREPWFRVVNGLARTLGISPDPGHVQFWSVRGYRRFLSAHADGPATIETYQYYQIARIERTATTRSTHEF